MKNNIKMFLFARWISICYADEHLDSKMRPQYNKNFDYKTMISVLNREDDYWWKKQLEHFNNIVYPNYLKNKSVNNVKEFLKK